MDSPFDAALTAYDEVWRCASNITATNAEEVRRRALTAAIRVVINDCGEAATKHLAANPNATGAEILNRIVGRWSALILGCGIS